jgi:hypothetical protein
MKFILTIDTEADNQWDHGKELSVKNIKFVPRFQDLCSRYFITPTYLVTSEICEDDFSRELLSDYLLTGAAEIGAHLHSWTTLPFTDKEGFRYNDNNHAFASELPEALLKEKLKNLTAQIEKSFGRRPSSFRSGRYGFNSNVARALIENSYLVDSSVTPYTCWSKQKGVPGGEGGPDFMDKKAFPYKIDHPEGSLLEIPVTILPTRFPFNWSDAIARNYFRHVDNYILLRIIRRLVYNNQPLWLRPYKWMTNDHFEELIKEAVNINLPYMVMIFHSSELMPGSSIYRSDKAAIERLYDQLENFFILLKKYMIGSVTLTGAAEDFKTISNISLGTTELYPS